ncbi:MAG: NIPSNAP family protein [Acidobacteriaceae bacterium]
MTSSLAASALALTKRAGAQARAETAAGGTAREYYELRKYSLQTGPQVKLADSYVADALIPALNRMGMSPVGAFNLDIGPETPSLYLLIPSTSLETLTGAGLRLTDDEQFMKAAAPFWNAPAESPAFVRVESSLLIAFEGQPKLTVPPATAQHGKRIFQLRTYESPSNQDHVRKVEMFHHGEFEIFAKAGFRPVFYGDALIGPRLPNLTYMLAFTDLTELTARWEVFRNAPAWKALSASPRYNFEAIVSNISNLILSPKPYSQI